MIPDNLEVEYYDNSKIYMIVELNEHEDYHGIRVKWFINGELQEISNWKNARLHGRYRDYFDDGQIWEDSNYVDNQLHGLRKFWYPNGMRLREDHYVAGKKHGSCTKWTEDGRLLFVEFYQHNKKITSEVKKLAKNIHNITEQEKIHIAIALGITL